MKGAIKSGRLVCHWSYSRIEVCINVTRGNYPVDPFMLLIQWARQRFYISTLIDHSNPTAKVLFL